MTNLNVIFSLNPTASGFLKHYSMIIFTNRFHPKLDVQTGWKFSSVFRVKMVLAPMLPVHLVCVWPVMADVSVPECCSPPCWPLVTVYDFSQVALHYHLCLSHTPAHSRPQINECNLCSGQVSWERKRRERMEREREIWRQKRKKGKWIKGLHKFLWPRR